MYRRRQKRSAAPVIIIVMLIFALIIGAVGYFGYRYYLEKTYPLRYSDYVERYSRENGIDKYLVYAVIKTESGFRADAVSDVGARGLMQIMEDTFDWIKFKSDDDETVYYEMYDPKTNIDFGCRLLGYLYEEFGNVEAVAAAYHAGRGGVNEWLSDKRYSKDGVHLDVIPIPDTAHYVDKITKAMDMYIRLYDK
ncbi:MAG: transglycosylase SLT domain-containing protein [Lachnospiraceae bacterium]|nr:transglycosylase SLT domain-containing protein [Ruminococcus sp.]MCM1274127.1 transglycosylase SLT domain-containing protein [Lachnospiraceae bacterium]